jgi:chaperone modulatory protein CbpM
MEQSMAIQGTELAWLDERETVTVTELSRVCALSEAELQELIDYGTLEPPHVVRQQRVFSARCVMPLRRAARLRQDLDLDLYAVAVLLGCLERIDTLEHELRSLQARLPHLSPQDP